MGYMCLPSFTPPFHNIQNASGMKKGTELGTVIRDPSMFLPEGFLSSDIRPPLTAYVCGKLGSEGLRMVTWGKLGRGKFIFTL